MMNIRFAAALMAVISGLLFPGGAWCAEETSATKPNILVIISDDLNDWIGPMQGNPQVKTPNIDKLAARGMTFMNNQCPAPLCNPSRTAFLSGIRPSTSGIYDNQQVWMPYIKPGLCLNDYIRTAGYQSLGAGKIYHYLNYRPEEWDRVVFSSDDTLPRRKAKRSPGPFGYREFTEGPPQKPFEEQRAEKDLVDAESVEWCKDRLTAAKYPFFMVCGIHRPHIPWDVPKKYFDLYPPDSIKLPEVKADDLDDVPPMGKKFAAAGPDGYHAKITKMKLWKDRVRAYLASVSYMDARVGELLDSLEKSPYKENTVVLFISDHGWHLGEKQHWSKSTLWNESARTPMIWSVPGVTPPGSVCAKGVDMMSIYPTICDLAGIPIPTHVEGISIKPLLTNPKATWTTPGLCTNLKGNHTLATEDWRYIRYADGTEELYDEHADPNEWTNVASKPENAEVIKKLAKFLPKTNAEPVTTKIDPSLPAAKNDD